MESPKITMAKIFATQRHVDERHQKYQNLPYTHHLQAVVNVLQTFGICDEIMIVSAWLHDVIEDCDVKSKEIEESFGPEIAQLVNAITNEKGENRKIRAALTYPKIRNAGSRAVMLKLADRIANTESGGSLLSMYKKEYSDFRWSLYSAEDCKVNLVLADMWKWLDNTMKGCL